jgi:preprotein translocase subunit SecA
LKDEDLCESIAILDKANEHATGGKNLRHSQLISILIFMQTKGDFGHIGQINTGEGKTTIISITSSLKVLQGFKVHVITSNEVLAKEGVESSDREKYYSILNIDVSHNNPEDESTSSFGGRVCYKADICFGSINNFQFDWFVLNNKL